MSYYGNFENMPRDTEAYTCNGTHELFRQKAEVENE